MKIQTFTWTVECKIFEIGEFIAPNSSRCPLPKGVYKVTDCVPPLFAGSQSTVFVEDQKFGFNAANFDLASPEENAFRYESLEVYDADQA